MACWNVQDEFSKENDQKFLVLFLEYNKKMPVFLAAVLATLQAAVIFQRFPHILRKWLILSSRQVLQVYSEIWIFCVIQYMGQNIQEWTF